MRTVDSLASIGRIRNSNKNGTASLKLSQGVLEEEGNFLRVETFPKPFDLNMGCDSGTICCREGTLAGPHIAPAALTVVVQITVNGSALMTYALETLHFAWEVILLICAKSRKFNRSQTLPLNFSSPKKPPNTRSAPTIHYSPFTIHYLPFRGLAFLTYLSNHWSIS